MSCLRLLAVSLCLLMIMELAHGHQFNNLMENLASEISDEAQTEAAKQLYQRVLPGNASQQFVIRVDRKLRSNNNGFDVANIVKKDANDKVRVTASSGATAAWALGEYLKEFCGCHISWDFRQLDLPKVLPNVDYTLTAQHPVRFWQNVCTYGYSYVWWKWPKWEEHLDWMAITGFNMALAASGQELIWWRTFASFGMTDEQLDDYFSGPAFLPWNRMGNLRRWGGPLGQNWMEEDSDLQKMIVARMKSLGMSPVAPGFNGIVPPEIISLYPNVTHFRLGNWGNFEDKYTASFLLDVKSSLARQLNDKFMQLYRETYGLFSFFSVDTFNEMTPPSESKQYLADYAKQVSGWVSASNSKAIWVMQGWMFLESYWTKDRIKSLLSNIPIGKVLMLDLASTTNPQYERTDSYFGQPFVFCMLHNYGGTMGLYGKAGTINTLAFDARNSSSMVGTGMTPEGIHNSYVAYDLMSETAWRKEPVANLSRWGEQYSIRRYGLEEEHFKRAWTFLMRSAYNCCSTMAEGDYTTTSYDTKLQESEGKAFRFHGLSTLTRLPSLNLKRELWYDEQVVLAAWDAIISGVQNIDQVDHTKNLALKHDVVDISRQAMANGLFNMYKKAMNAYHMRDIKLLNRLAKRFIILVRDIDVLLGSGEGFLLGSWLEDAKSTCKTKSECVVREFDARNQLTLWGPHGEILDYAAKQWSGLVGDYYLPRWKLFFKMLKRSLKKKGKRWNQKLFRNRFIRKVGIPFTLSDKTYPTRPTGDAFALAARMHKKWRMYMQ